MSETSHKETWTRPRLLRAIREHGLTSQQLAADLGVSMSAVTNWRTGSNEPGALASEKLTNYFGPPEKYGVVE